MQCYKCGLELDADIVGKVAPQDSSVILVTVQDANAGNSSGPAAQTSRAKEIARPAAQSQVADADADAEKGRLPTQPNQQTTRIVVGSAVHNDESYPDTIPFPPKSEIERDIGIERQPFLEPPNASDSLPSIDLVARARWGQRALLSSLALLCIVAAAYFFLRSEPASVVPDLKTDAKSNEKPNPKQDPVPSPPLAPISKPAAKPLAKPSA